MIEKIKIDFRISGTKITIPFSAICSVTDKKFTGFVISEYEPKTEVIEYCSLETFINKTCEKDLTAEQLTNLIYEEIENSINPKYLKVTVDVKESDAHQPVVVWKESL